MKHTKLFKVMTAAVCMVTLTASMIGCGKQETENTEGKTVISVGMWPGESDPTYEAQEKMRKAFMEKYPDIVVNTDTYMYSVDTFTAKATAKQLPTMYSTWFTEVDKLVSAGYCADVTDKMQEYGYTEAMNPEVLDMVKDDSGKIYGVPWSAYAQGLYINKKLFKEAGLVNEDGNIKVPDTYEQLAEYAQIIKEKTGVAGYVIPNANNCGGWHLMNIAWSNGVEFVEQQEDGKWKATFDTPEFKKTLEYLYDLRWNKEALPLNTGVNQGEIVKLFATEQAAMMFYNPPCSVLSKQYGMNIDDIMVTRMPKGSEGRYSQMGGNLWMIRDDATPEQIDACFKWLMFTGVSPNLTDEEAENLGATQKLEAENNGIVLPQEAFPIWVKGERNEKTNAVYQKYANVDIKDYEQYLNFEDVTIKSEVPVCCQELYSVLDKCVQEIETNKSIDIDELIKTSVNDYQVNHLDNIK